MEERDELAKLIFITDNSNWRGDTDALWAQARTHSTIPGHADAEYAYAIADGLLAAGYSKNN